MTNKDFEAKVEENTLKYTTKIDKIAVAVSGGSDSLSLVVALKKTGFNVLAILVNHNLRTEAKDEIKQTIKTLEKININYVVKEWDGKYTKNLEAEARKNRYQLLFDVCKKNKIKTLCIGHHIDDQIETFLLNLTRGSGLDGLCAMPKKMVIENITIIRPILSLTKQNCREYLQDLKISWCEDSSNKDTKYKRNKLRFLLEQIEDRDLITKRVVNSIDTLQEVRETLDKIVEGIFKDNNIISFSSKQKRYEIDKNAFLNLTSYLQKTILTKCINELSNRDYKMRLYQIENIIESIKTQDKFKRTLAKCVIEMKNNIVYIYKQ